MLTDEQLAEIERRADAATPGEWYRRDGGTEVIAESAELVIADTRFFLYRTNHRDQEDAEFIAQARQDIPALLASLREARGEVAELLAIADAGALQLREVAAERSVERAKVARLWAALDDRQHCTTCSGAGGRYRSIDGSDDVSWDGCDCVIAADDALAETKG